MNSQIASDLSYECLQLRRRRGELSTPPLDNTYRRIYRAADLRPFIADVDECGDCANPNPPTRAEGEVITEE